MDLSPFRFLMGGKPNAKAGGKAKATDPPAVVAEEVEIKVDHSSNLTISSDVGGKGEQAVLTITVTGSVCRLEDLQLSLAAEVVKWRQTSPKAKSERPCGCKDAN